MNWEYYFDQSHYHMWAVRPVGDNDFNSARLFHVGSQAEAAQLKQLLDNAQMAEIQHEQNTAPESDALQFFGWAEINATPLPNGRYIYDAGDSTVPITVTKEELYQIFINT